MSKKPSADMNYDALWRKTLEEGHGPLNIAHRIFRYLPSPPRCKVCFNPFGGVGGKLVAAFGFQRSRKNPNLCNRCCDRLPPGGAEVDIAVLFADVRGSSQLAEQVGPTEFANVLNGFYRTATEILVGHDAVIDKLIGDEVMAFFVRGFCGPEYRRHGVDAALELMRAIGAKSKGSPALQIGITVDAGLAYVGNVGGAETMDFTALGDPVNIAAHMQAAAGPGEILLTSPVYDQVADRFPLPEQRELSLKKRDMPLTAYVLRPA